jgi:hypothetical protein
MAANVLYASLFIPNVERLELDMLPSSHREGPIYLNVLKHLDLPQAVALAAERSEVFLEYVEPSPWRFAEKMGALLGWEKNRLQIRPLVDFGPPGP